MPQIAKRWGIEESETIALFLGYNIVFVMLEDVKREIILQDHIMEAVKEKAQEKGVEVPPPEKEYEIFLRVPVLDEYLEAIIKQGFWNGPVLLHSFEGMEEEEVFQAGLVSYCSIHKNLNITSKDLYVNSSDLLNMEKEIALHHEQQDAENLSSATPKGNHEKYNLETENYFRLETDYWQIYFQGKRWSIKQSMGMQYITHLIRRAYTDEPEIHVSDLFYLVKGRPAIEGTELNRLTKDQIAEYDLDVTGLEQGVDMMTPEGKQWVIKQVQQLAKEIDKANMNGSTQDALRLREIKEELEEHIKKAHGISGRVRVVSDLNENIRKSISKAIEHVLVNMGKKDEDQLAMYLDDHLNKGFFCSFRKDPNISWKILKK